MARGTWVYDKETGKLVPKGEYLALKAARAPRKRSGLGCPLVIGSMPPTLNMADGKVYDDKRSYHRAVARAGCEVVGYDKNFMDHIKPAAFDEKANAKSIAADVKKAIEQVNNQ